MHEPVAEPDEEVDVVEHLPGLARHRDQLHGTGLHVAQKPGQGRQVLLQGQDADAAVGEPHDQEA